MPDAAKSFFGWLDDLLREKNSQMAWGRILPGHVLGVPAEKPFVRNDDYVIVRLGSMYISQKRELWLKLSPLLHSAVTVQGLKAVHDETAVVGPAQFGDLATAPADRSVVQNQKLAGPAVWRGGDLKVAAGLFAVPKDQAASALLATLSQLSGLGIPGLKESLEIANIVKSGIEGLIGLNGTRPVLAVKDALIDEVSASPCVLVGLADSASGVDFRQLWVKGGRLYTGPDVNNLRVVERFDHILLSVERGGPRQDWRGLPSLLPHEAKFAEPLADASAATADVITRLNQAFRAFDVDLSGEEGLTNPDKERIRRELVSDLKERLVGRDPLYDFKATERRSLESRTVGGLPRKSALDETFSFLDVSDLVVGAGTGAAPGTDPF